MDYTTNYLLNPENGKTGNVNLQSNLSQQIT